MDFLQELSNSGFDISTFLTAALLFAAGSLILGFVGRLLFGHDSPLANAVSSAIGILFIYMATVTVMTVGGELEQFRQFLTPLPYVSIDGETLHFFVFEGASQIAICRQVLSMIILSFLVNLLDTWLPVGNNPVTWFLFRCITVVLSIIVHWFTVGMLNAALPNVITDYAPIILLGVLALMLAVGALKFLVGAAIATINPIIGALYTFFFANIIGKQISKAVLSTALLTALVWALNYFGIATLSISMAALLAYLPFLAVLLVVWYVVNHIL